MNKAALRKAFEVADTSNNEGIRHGTKVDALFNYLLAADSGGQEGESPKTAKALESLADVHNEDVDAIQDLQRRMDVIEAHAAYVAGFLNVNPPDYPPAGEMENLTVLDHGAEVEAKPAGKQGRKHG